MSKQERRFLPNEVVKVEDEQGNKTISGYASVANQLSEPLGGFREIIAPGAFRECLSNNPDVRHLVDHDPAKIIGRTKSGTLRLKEDEHGLHFECDLPDTTVAKDLAVSISRGDISQCSFGFFCEEDFWSKDKATGEPLRTITKARVFDTSCVSFPAYEGTSVNLRSLFPEDKGQIPAEIKQHIEEIRAAKPKDRNLRSVMAAVSGTKWAILPEKLETICSFLQARQDGKSVSKEEVQSALMGFDMDMGEDSSSNEDVTPSPVSVIQVYGTIGQKMTMMTKFSGGASCEGITKSFRAALADPGIKSIVLDIDSPGGTVTGVPELAAEILASRGQKPIIAVANGMAASAALWIASAADKFVVIPSGEVGSIGVYTTHQDVSSAMDKAGVKLSFIKAGKYKTEGNPYEPASAEFIAYQQSGVDEFYGMFTQAVANGRGATVEKVEADFGQGRMLSAKDALAAGLVDSVDTLDNVVAGLLAQYANESTDASLLAADNTTSTIKAESMVGCECDCPGCTDGNCVNCSDVECDGADDGCVDCGMEDEGMDDYDAKAAYNTAAYKLKVMQMY